MRIRERGLASFLPVVLSFAVASGVAAVAAAGCAQEDGDPAGSPLDGVHASMHSMPGTPQGGAAHCAEAPSAAGPSGPALKLDDPSSLPACSPACDGAHCVPANGVPTSVQGSLATCAGGFCVPDSLIKSGGAKPPACTSLMGAKGVCLSTCVPQVAMFKDLLPPTGCAADERCAPCVNPLTNMSTGACDIGGGGSAGSGGGACTPDDGGGAPPASDGGPSSNPGDSGSSMACPHVGPPVVDPSMLPPCGSGATSGAHCVSAALVPMAMQAQLATCPGMNGGFCVPDKFIAAGGNFIPATCSSLNNAEGRCLNVVVPQVASQVSVLPQSTCDATERCTPCFNPIDGKDTGACKLSCDPGPKMPATTLKACCKQAGTDAGRCVPASSVPAAQQMSLGNKECVKGAELCVPSEQLSPTFKPTACNATGFIVGTYTGVCLSTCLELGLGQFFVARGTCEADHECIPCKTPLGTPSGAPGCPP
jgi:hypothetical protein